MNITGYTFGPDLRTRPPGTEIYNSRGVLCYGASTFKQKASSWVPLIIKINPCCFAFQSSTGQRGAQSRSISIIIIAAKFHRYNHQFPHRYSTRPHWMRHSDHNRARNFPHDFCDESCVAASYLGFTKKLKLNNCRNCRSSDTTGRAHHLHRTYAG